MKLKKRLVGLMLTAALATFPIMLTACQKPGKDSSEESSITESSVDESVAFEATGAYYATVDGGECTLTIGESDCSLVAGEQALTGTYTYDGTTLKFTFSDGSTATATYDGLVLAMKKGNVTYSFYAKVDYTVTFDTNGGTAIDAATVVNGKTVAKPEAPTKEGYWFVGWYKDSAYTSLYDFGAIVTANTTVYARFVEKVEGYEYDVNFVVDGATLTQMKTRGGVIYNSELPTPEKEGAEFLGWWVSSYGDATKLSYQYNEQQLGQHTTLYAVWKSDKPVISVNGDNISWTAVGGSTYDVAVKNAKGNKVAGTTTPETSYAFDFSDWEAGDYTIEVSILGDDEVYTAHYKNKALDKICYINASDDRVLTFNEVAGAEKYLITIDCGDANHVHKQVEVTTPVYDFSGCQMQVGGITFTVEAVADGYLSSKSDVQSYEASLAAITGLTINTETEIATWDAVENATAYVVEIIDDGVSLGQTTMTETTVSLRGLTGALEVKVYPIARDYNSSATQSAVFNNIRLAIPMGLALSGHSLVWDAVEGATGYIVKVGDATYTTTSAELVLIDEHFTNNAAVISVQAVCGDEAKASLYSDAFTVRSDNKMDAASLAYNKGELSWGAVLGAAKYGVRINGGEETLVEEGLTAPVAFTQAGATTLEVRSYNAQGEQSDWVALTVDVYSITFEAEGGKLVATMYKAEGDNVTLPDTEFLGYTFAGWYDVSKPLENNGKKQETTFLQGAGNLTLYAGYTPNTYKVTFDYDGLAEGVTETEVVYSKAYEGFPAPECTDVTKVFAGWFSQPNAQGIQYTDHKGESSKVWATAEDTVLYAGWYSVMKFTLVGTEAEPGYAVSKDETGIRYVEDLRIPATYAGLPVIMIESGAFANCSNLRTIAIPDTVKSIFISSDNQDDTGSAFENCSSLQQVTVYEVADKTYDAYFEDDGTGALIYNNPNTGKKEIKFLPAAYDDGDDNTAELVYTIPNGVQTIPTSAFFNSKVSKLIIPASVTQIDSSAFKGSAYLTKLEFLSAEDGVEQGLTLASGVFDGCNRLVEIDLPARIIELNLDIFSSRVEKINITGFPVANADVEYHSIDGVLCQGDTIVYAPRGRSGAYRIPVVINKIGDSAFENCSRLTAVSIPGNVTEIGKKAFYSCDLLRILTFEGTESDAGLSIAEQAFYSCNQLDEIKLSPNVTTIAAHAFGSSSTTAQIKVTVTGDGAGFATNAFVSPSGTASVTELYLGENVQNLEIAGVFGSKLSTVVIDGANPYLATLDNVVYDAEMKTLLFFPGTKKGDFKVPDGVETISANAFKGKEITSIHIPASVTSIGDFAFAGASYIGSITIDDGDKALVIGKGAFTRMSGLVYDDLTLVLPSRVTVIGEGAFANTSFVSIEIKDGDKELTIGAYAFKEYDSTSSSSDMEAYSKKAVNLSGGRLTSLSLPTRLRTIGYEAFAGTFKYVQRFDPSQANIDLVIPEGVTTIENYAFASNYMLKSISLPSTLTKLGEYSTADALISVLVFDNCKGLQTISVATGNTAFSVVDGVLYGLKDGNADQLYLSPMANLGNEGVVNVPATVTKVWDRAFRGSTNIHTVQFPADVVMNVTLGADIFVDCESLKNVNLPIGLTTIPSKMFNACDSLETITVPYTVGLIETMAFYSCANLKTIAFAPTPDGVEATPLILEAGKTTDNCFYLCSKLTSVELPERTTTIGDYAFYKSKITEVVIPSTVTTIGKYAFSESELTKVTFAEGSALTAIQDYTFTKCKALTEVQLPDTVETIGASVFVECPKLTTVNLPASLTTIGASAFTRAPITTIAIPATVTSIGASAFEACNAVTLLTFAEGSVLTTIGDNAFNQCTQITSISVPATVTTIGKSAFASCLSVTSLTFETNDEGYSAITKIGDSAFAGLAITSFTFPTTASAMTLGKNIVDSCKLESVTLTKGVTEILGVLDGAKISGFVDVTEDNENFKTVEGERALLDGDRKGILYVYTTIVGECDLSVFGDITYVGEGVYAGQTQMTKLIVPVTVQEIQESAFEGCTALTAIEFKTQDGVDQALTTIGKNAFKDCESLLSVSLPENVTTLGDYAFANADVMNSITLNSKLATVGTYVFRYAGQNAESLTVTVPEGVTTIGDYMFQYTKTMTTITLPSTLTKIGASAFNASGLAGENPVKFTAKADGTYALTTIGKSAFASCSAITKFNVPESVTSLGDSVFNGCRLMTEATIPEGLKTIPKQTFYNTGITSFTISEVVTTIGEGAFYNCTGLTSIEIPAKVTKIDKSAFRGSGLTSITIPANVTTIGETAFQDCAALTSVVFGDKSSSTSVNVVIGTSAFLGCDKLTNVTFSKHVKEIGKTAFKETGLTSVNIPATVTSIKDQAFYDCVKLTEATLGSSKLTTLGKEIFRDCKKLAKVTFGDGFNFKKATTYGSKLFTGCTNATFELNLPTSCTIIYNDAFYVSSSAGLNITSIDLTKVTYVGNNAFKNCKKLNNVTWGTGLTSIGNYAFSGCAALETANVASATALLGTNAFEGCKALKNVTLPSTLTILPATIFKGCVALESIAIPATVQEIKNNAFEGCEKLAAIDVAHVATIGKAAFKGCEALTAMDISGVTTAIADELFYGCTLLANVTINDMVSHIGSSAFRDCTSLQYITLPSALAGINGYAFNGSGLKEIIIPEGVTSFLYSSTSNPSTSSSAFTFSNCTSLEKVVLPEGFLYLGKGIFKGCTSLRDVSLPSTILMIGDEVFMDCALTYVQLPADLVGLGDVNVFGGCANLQTFSITASNDNFETRGGALYAKKDVVDFDSSSGKIFAEEGWLIAYPYARIEDGVITLAEGCTGVLAGSTSNNGTSLFSACVGLKEIIIPASMTKIAAYGFAGCHELERVVIPQTVLEIDAGAFYKCEKVSTLIFEDDGTAEDLNFIGTQGNPYFSSTALTEVTIPLRMKVIPARLFGYTNQNVSCTNLKTVHIPEGITEIGKYAFAYTSVENLELPDSLTYIGESAFLGANISSFNFNKVETVDKEAFKKATFETFTVPAGVKTWGTNVLAECPNLTTVTFEEGVTAVPSGMFYNCPMLENVTLIDSITSINANAFYGNTALKTIDLNKVTHLGLSAFSKSGLTSIVIPEGVTHLMGDSTATMDSSGGKVFMDCESLESVTLPSTLEMIGCNIFKNCTALKSLDIPASVYYIGYYAFDGSGLESVEIKNPETMFYYSFAKAKNLKTVVLPEGLTSLGFTTFKDCVALTEINIPSTVVSFDVTVVGANGSVFYNEGATFEGCTALTEIVLPAGLKKIPSKTFYNCSALTTVVLPEGLEEIGDQAFYSCKQIASLVLPENVSLTGKQVFYGWTKDQTIYLYVTQAYAEANWRNDSSYDYWNYQNNANMVYEYVPVTEGEQA